MVSRTAKHWLRFSYRGDAFSYPGEALMPAWKSLHRGDGEPWPDAKRIAALLAVTPAAGVQGLDAAALAAALQAAWRAFHAGDFEGAWNAGRALGVLGTTVAVKAAAVHVTYVEEHDGHARALLESAVESAALAGRIAPAYANAHYMHAFALGRLSQRMTVLRALAAGHAPQVRASLEAALGLEPKHADAEIALGLWHAEIVGKVGALAARVSYGANRKAALAHFKSALKLNPDSAIAHIEYGNGLLALDGDAAQDEATALYEQAAALAPHDAMQWLDVKQARLELD